MNPDGKEISQRRRVKGGRNKSQCRRMDSRVLQSTMSRVEESRPVQQSLRGGLRSIPVPQLMLSRALKVCTPGINPHYQKQKQVKKTEWTKNIYLTVNRFLVYWIWPFSLMQNWSLEDKSQRKKHILSMSKLTLLGRGKVVEVTRNRTTQPQYPGHWRLFTNTAASVLQGVFHHLH